MCAKSGNRGNCGNQAHVPPKLPYFREPGTPTADG